MSSINLLVTGDDPIHDYRTTLKDALPVFMLQRRFVAADGWTKATTDDGIRYLGLFREQEPDLPAVLLHRSLLILGEPGAGKSTTGHAVVRHILECGPATALPVITSLKSYKGDLRSLLLSVVPANVMDAVGVTRTYILDGIDEVPSEHRDSLALELDDILIGDATARIVLTSRQAFAAQHPDAFPPGLTTYHLLEFADEDIDACARHHGINTEEFKKAVQNAECDDEIRNPFVLTVMLERYKNDGDLSSLRSDNVGYVVDRLIQSRPAFNVIRQRRALRMLAITCETAARNELTQDEALRVLLEAMELTPDVARQLLDELSHSILLRTAGGISFQMRSYGEYLAAEELHDETVDRLKELAFTGDTPIDTWLNTVTYLAEMNDKVRTYFVRYHPEWLINVSPSAFSDDERTDLTRQILHDINAAKTYLIGQERLRLPRLAALLTPSILDNLTAELASDQEHKIANALVLLGIRRHPAIVSQAVGLVTSHRGESTLRYSAIISLINTGENTVINDLIAFAEQTDPYYINIIDAIGSLCTPDDFPVVLPLLRRTNACLSSACYHFRELKTKEALDKVITYLTLNPGVLDGHDLNSYLEPIIDLIPKYLDDDLGKKIGILLAGAEREHLFLRNDEFPQAIIRHAKTAGKGALVVRAMVESLAPDGTRLFHTCALIGTLVTPAIAEWLKSDVPSYAQDLFPWLCPGPARDILNPRTPDQKRAHEEEIAALLEQEKRRGQAATTTRAQHQQTLTKSRDIDCVIGAAERLPKEHWPDLPSEQREWLGQAVNDMLVSYDLGISIKWEDQNRWTHPGGLNPLLRLIDYYRLHLKNDLPIVLALRSWPDEAVSNYYRREGFSAAAHEQLNDLLRSRENQNITSHVLTFLRQADYKSPEILALLKVFTLDENQTAHLRVDALERLTNIDPKTDFLLLLADDREPSVKDRAFRALVKQQHQATIMRALATLSDDDLRSTEVYVSGSSPLDWIGSIAAPFAIKPLCALRERGMSLNLWRVTIAITGIIAKIDKNWAVNVINQQIPVTPPAWQPYYRQEADNLRRAGRIDAAQQTPFDGVIRKLKGATSMILVKVWCEGATDRPVFRQLLNQLQEEHIAETIGLIHGWGSLGAETEPERWLDGCRQAIIIMDGDVGRKLNKKNEPFTDKAKELDRRFKKHPITLRILRRYGIENYFPRHACEAVLRRDLNGYFPIPASQPIEAHFCEPRPLWLRWLNRFRKKKPVTFYQKGHNRDVAEHITLADIKDTDLADILDEVKRRAEDARRY